MNTEKRRQWLTGMGYSPDEIELILKFDGFFADGYAYNSEHN